MLKNNAYSLFHDYNHISITATYFFVFKQKQNKEATALVNTLKQM